MNLKTQERQNRFDARKKLIVMKICRKKNLFGGLFNEIVVWLAKYKVKTWWHGYDIKVFKGN